MAFGDGTIDITYKFKFCIRNRFKVEYIQLALVRLAQPIHVLHNK